MAPVAAWSRLEAPAWLSEDAQTLWYDIVASKPPEWFKADTAPLLEAYCRMAVEHRRTARALEATDPADLPTYKALSEIVTRFAAQMKMLATSMRLTPQSRYTTGSAATADRKAGLEVVKPWQRRA